MPLSSAGESLASRPPTKCCTPAQAGGLSYWRRNSARAAGGTLLAGWGDPERRALIGGLVALPDEIAVMPMRDLAWRMGVLIADHQGLSTLGAEAVAAALAAEGRLLGSARDDGPGIRRCCQSLGVGYDALER
jgi:hypothetical protein